MSLDRRSLMTSAGIGLGVMGLAAGMASAATAEPARPKPAPAPTSASLADLGLQMIPGQDQAAVLQAAIDQASARGVGLRLSPGNYSIGRALVLRPNTRLAGALGVTHLRFPNGGGLQAERAGGIRIADLAINGAGQPFDTARGIEGLLDFRGCHDVHLSGLTVRDSAGHGIILRAAAGSITGCEITGARHAGIHTLDDRAVEIAHNHVHDCGDNGIQVWTSKPAECGTRVHANRIERIAANSGGTGQNGNGVNIFRAAGVLVSNNRIADCAYSAVRGNAASNIQMVANSCARLGEVALYAEFGFEGALIASNLVDTAAAGISVTNFNEGGRLAVVQGNLIRNLARREADPQDKRGEGISVEADSVVANNVVEAAPTAGIFIGWGRHMRDVSVTGNLIRNSTVGIAVQADRQAATGSVLIANNLISGARGGAIRTLRLHEPYGADLARGGSSPLATIVCAGNIAT